MELTPQLRAWLVENCDVAAESSEEDFKAAAMNALNSGQLSVAKLHELTQVKEEETVETAEVEAIEKEEVVETVVAEVQQQDDDESAKAFGLLAEAISGLSKKIDSIDKKAAAPAPAPIAAPEATKGSKVMASQNIRVRGAEELYSSTKGAAICPEKHVRAGEQAHIFGRPLETPSQLDKAVSGAYFKWCLNAGSSAGNVPRSLRMTEHDEQLMKYAMHNMAWTGLIGGEGTDSSGATKVDGRKLSDFEIKSLIDDSTSGGLEAAPIVFDDAVILTPVLHGELFPLVNVVPISRGRRVEGFSLGNPTFTSGTAEGTAISLFSTSGYVSAFDTTIFNAVGAMEIGLDFEEDSPVNIGALVAQRYGETALEYLDNQIANGDGTTEPQGVINASGVTSVSTTNGTTGGPTVDDYEGLMFGIAKQYRTAADRARTVFCMNDTTYKRARAIAVGSGDVRRVFGMETNAHGDYSLLGHNVKIQNDMGNSDVFFANLRYYRMYRRLGLNIRVETGGKELAQKNLKLVVVRMRFGGQLEQGGAAAVTSDAQS